MKKSLCTFPIVVISLFVLFPSSAVAQEDRQLKEKITASERLLKAKWKSFLQRRAEPAELSAVENTRFSQPPMRRRLATESTETFESPTESVKADGQHRLVVRHATNRIGDDEVFLRSYNGGLVGPTIRAKPGETLKIKLINQLADEPEHTGDHNSLHEFNTTNLHTHGLHVSPSGNSDNVLLKIKPGEEFDYEIKIPEDHACGTFWYHAHKHGAVAAQVASGMSGALIIEGGMDEVEQIKNAQERVLVLQQIPYFNQGLAQGVIEPEYAGDLFGPGDWDTLGRFTTVNGKILPVINMNPGEVERWRIVNSAFRERIQLKLERDTGTGPEIMTLREIAVDGLPLGKVVDKTQLELWPGYRSDVLV